MAQKLARNEGIARRRIEVIHNGVDPDRFPALSEDQRAAARREIGVDRDETLFLHVAGFRPVKDHVSAVRAFARLRDAGSNAVLAFAGTGPTACGFSGPAMTFRGSGPPPTRGCSRA